MVRTLLFHGINTGSNPVKGSLKVTTKIPYDIIRNFCSSFTTKFKI